MKKDIYYVIQTNALIHWLINYDAPKEYLFESNNKISLINPNYYSSVSRANMIPEVKFHVKTRSNYLIATHGIIVKLDENGDDLDPTSFIKKNFDYLRIETKQTVLRGNILRSSYPVELEDLCLIKDVFDATNNGFNKILYDTSIRWNDLQSVDLKIKNNFSVPIYYEVLIDAWEEFLEGEFRKTILFSTIAIEAMLGSKFDESYKCLILEDNNESKFRIVENTKIKQSDLIDPIYKRLKEVGKFRHLLHEIPLYLWNKSIMVEDRSFYDRLLELYSTRNKIVHQGIPDDSSNELFPINKEGSLEALEIANKIFKWCDIKEFESLEFGKHIKL